MKRLNYLLTKLAEEASEVSQAALKCSLFGLDDHHPERTTTNVQELEQEMVDILAVFAIIQQEFGILSSLSEEEARTAAKRKFDKLDHYYHYILEKEKKNA